MAMLTKFKDPNELTLVIDNLDEYLLICRALDVFQDTPVENLSPEQMLLDAIFDDDTLRIEARTLLASLQLQEKEIPIFQQMCREPEKEITE